MSNFKRTSSLFVFLCLILVNFDDQFIEKCQANPNHQGISIRGGGGSKSRNSNSSTGTSTNNRKRGRNKRRSATTTSTKRSNRKRQTPHNSQKQQTQTQKDNVKKIKLTGTQMTGTGSRSKKNRSIFLNSPSSNTNSDSPIKGRMYAKVTKEGELLLFFPSKSNNIHNVQDAGDDDGIPKVGKTLSLSINYNINQNGSSSSPSSSIHAEYWNKNQRTKITNNDNQQDVKIKRGKRKKNRKGKKRGSGANIHEHSFYDHRIYRQSSLLSSSSSSSSSSSRGYNLSEKWIPIEGIYGIYNLPSGPYLVLITDSELIYKSSSHSEFNNSDDENKDENESNQQEQIPLINMRRIKSMEIIPLPLPFSSPLSSLSNDEDGGDNMRQITTSRHHLIKAEQSQLNLLRQSFKEHDFYYTSPQQQQQQDYNIENEESDNHNDDDNHDVIVQDITHTLQRCFVHWSQSRDKEQRRKEMYLKKINNSLFLAPPDLLVHSNNNISDSDDCKILLKQNGNSDFDTIHELNILSDSHNCDKLCLDELEKSIINSGFDINSIFDSNTQSEKKVNQSWWKPLLHISQESSTTNDDNDEAVLRPDTRFFWNEECVQPFLSSLSQQDVDDSQGTPYHFLLEYTIPVTSAFVGIQRNIELASKSASKATSNASTMSSVKYDQLLISRRSKFRAGTRFTKRGADGMGDVANFAETEQICIVSNDTEDKGNESKGRLELYSHVQTRGSIPLRWSSPTDIKTYRPKVHIGTDPIAQARAMRSHLLEQLAIYSTPPALLTKSDVKLVFVNLIDKHSDQGRLGRAFGAVLDAVLTLYGSESHQGRNHSSVRGLSPDVVSHIWFDFHAECKKGRWYKLRNLLDEVAPTLDKQGYFCAVAQGAEKGSNWDILDVQNGVVRTNCMDCLDRTNVVQSMFGRYMLYKHFGENKNRRKRRLSLESIKRFKHDKLKLPWENGEVSHRLLWADNADAISRLYAGTPALKGDFTRTGKRTKRGALDDGLNSVTRFYLNNFLDADRQKGMDLLTGFTNFEVNLEDENRQGVQVTNKGTKTSKHSRQQVIHNEKVRSPFMHDSRINLGWLPGDLESHLRSAALTAQYSRLSVEDSFHPYPFSSAEALKDIGRRASMQDPWWVDDNDTRDLDTKQLSKTISATSQPGGGHVVGALIALSQAPITTVIAILCFLLPGIS